LQSRTLRLCTACLAASIRRDDRCRHAHQQDGACTPQGLRPDAGAALRHLHGQLRKRRRLLPLFLRGCARLRSHRTRRHLRAGLSADGGGARVRHNAVAAEDSPHGEYRPLMAALDDLASHIKAALGDAVLSTQIAFGELTLSVTGSYLTEVLSYLRDAPGYEFKILIDICGVDYPNRERRFDVVYHLLSVAENARIRVKVETDETTPVPSCVSVYPAAN